MPTADELMEFLKSPVEPEPEKPAGKAKKVRVPKPIVRPMGSDDLMDALSRIPGVAMPGVIITGVDPSTEEAKDIERRLSAGDPMVVVPAGASVTFTLPPSAGRLTHLPPPPPIKRRPPVVNVEKMIKRYWAPRYEVSPDGLDAKWKWGKYNGWKVSDLAKHRDRYRRENGPAYLLSILGDHPPPPAELADIIRRYLDPIVHGEKETHAETEE